MVISPFISAQKPLVPIDSMPTPPDSMPTEPSPPVDSTPTKPKMKPQQRKSFCVNGRAIATLCGVAMIGFGLIRTVYSEPMSTGSTSTEPKIESQQKVWYDLGTIITISGLILTTVI